MHSKSIPSHVVVIPDGNRRWAKQHNLPSAKGHFEGYMRAKELLQEAKKEGIQYLTLWAFSTENWSREESEVKDLLFIIYTALVDLRGNLQKEKTRFFHLGRKDRLNEKILTLISLMEKETEEYNDFCLCLAIDYGGEDEILRASKKLRESDDEAKTIKDFLDTSLLTIPDPDFIIRTSGEQRTSGILPLQSLYSEWYFDTTLFPDFTKEHFKKTLEVFSERGRRFGK